MEMRRLGRSEVDVSRIILGCGNFGGIGSAPEFFGRGETREASFANLDAATLTEGLGTYEWVQNSYSLLDRGDEAELLPLCRAHGLGYTPFSPLAGGWLTGKYRRGEPFEAGSRMAMRPEAYADFGRDEVYDALEAFERAAAERGVDPAALGLAWLLAQPDVTAVIVGPRRPEHLEPARRALELELSGSEAAELAALFS